jgi:hypothetical protein
VPIIDVGTYDSLLSYDNMFDEQIKEARQEGKFVCEDFDWNKYKQTIVDTSNQIFQEELLLEKYGVKSIMATKMGSPLYYNYITDWLDLKVEVEDDFLDRAEKVLLDAKNEKKIDSFMKKHWETRDGFISSMPAERVWDLPKVFKMLREDYCGIDDMRAFGTVLMLLMVVEDQYSYGSDNDEVYAHSSYLTDLLVNRLIENCYIGDYVTVLDRGEVEKLYGDYLFLGAIDELEKQLKEGLERYKASGASEDEIASVSKEAKCRLGKIADYRERTYDAVERYHGDPKMVKYSLDDLRDEWMGEFSGCPFRVTKGIHYDPNQLELPL